MLKQHRRTTTDSWGVTPGLRAKLMLLYAGFITALILLTVYQCTHPT